LNLHSAGMACDQFITGIPPYPNQYSGRGIVICGGGVKYFTNAWVCINMLRRLCCGLPMQLWHLGEHELDERMESLLTPLGVQCIDAGKLRKKFPARRLGGWELKPYAILHSSFREVLFLDADNVPVANPEFLFDSPQFHSTGAIYWPDYNHTKNEKLAAIWRSCGLRPPREREFETGQILVDKQRCWPALRLTLWFNENSDFYYRYLHGDKETFHLAFRKLKKSYALVPTPIHTLPGVMCQHDFQRRRLFQHRNTDKWDFFLHNKRIKDFWFENECRQDLRELQRIWDGKSSAAKIRVKAQARLKPRSVKIATILVSHPSTKSLSQQTLKNLAKTDWIDQPLPVEIDSPNDRPQPENTILLDRSWMRNDGLFMGTAAKI